MNLLRGLTLSVLLSRLIVLLTALPVHEAAHAYAAEKMGDSTARYQRRLSLNPLDHIDPVGAVMILLFGFGFARPVQINPAAFRDRKKGEVIVSLAGPLSNLVLAWVTLILYKLMAPIAVGLNLSLASGAAKVFWTMTWTNLGLAAFNLLPVPPLDGWHALCPFLPYETKWKIQQYENYFFWGVLLLIWLGVFDRVVSLLMNILYFVINYASIFVDLLLRAVT